MVSSSSSMSSRSRQSSKSTASGSSPAWRSGSIPKQAAQASLSYVTAEPQQGSPLASATSRLPSPSLRHNKESASAISPATIPSTAPEDMDEGIAGIFDTAGPVTTSQQSPQPGHNEHSETKLEEANAASSGLSSKTDEHSSAIDTQASVSSTPSTIPRSSGANSLKSTVRKVSWFSSLTKGKGKKKDGKSLAIPFPSTEQPEPKEAQSNPSSSMTAPPAPDSTPSSSIPPTLPHVQPEVTDTPSATSQSTGSNKPPPPVDVPPSSPPRDIPMAQSPNKRSWFSSTPKPNGQAPTPIMSAPSSIPSSLDEVVPPISNNVQASSPPPQGIVSSPSSQGDKGAPRQRLSSLNPSTSRFVLNVPLLGRPRSNSSLSPTHPGGPVNEAINSAPGAVSDERKDELDKANNPEESQESSSSPDHPESAKTAVSASDTAPGHDLIGPSPSWWNYLSWNTRSSSAPPSVIENASAPSDVPTAFSQPIQPLASESAPVLAPTASDHGQSSSTPEAQKVSGGMSSSPMHIHPSESGQGEGKSGSSVGPISRATIKDAQAIHSSVDNGKTSGANDKDVPIEPTHDHNTLDPSSSTWYNPWTWYATPSTSTSDVEPQAAVPTEPSGAIVGSVSQDSHTNTNNSKDSAGTEAVTLNAKTTATGVVSGNSKDDAHVNGQKDYHSPTQPVVASLENDQSVGRQSLVSNPIEDTIGTNRSAWASFFSSKSLFVKTITGPVEVKRDENGVEIMDIDDDDEGEKPPMDVTPKDSHRGRDDQAKDIGTIQSSQQEPPSSKSKDQGVPANLLSGQQSPTMSTTDKKASEVSSPRRKPVAPPLTISESVKRETIKQDPANQRKTPPKQVETTKSSSPARSTKSARSSRPRSPPPPNLVLPTWQDTFHTAPRNYVPPPPVSTFTKTMQFVSGVLFASEKNASTPSTTDGRGVFASRDKGKGRETDFAHFGRELPRALDIVGDKFDPDVLRGCRRVVVIGIHGWFPGAIMRTVLGEPTGTSQKFVNMMVQALEEFQKDHDVRLEKITKMPLEGEGTIDSRVEKLYSTLKANDDWMADIHAADAILVATHSQGSVVSTHLLDCLIRDQHIRTSFNTVEEVAADTGLPTAGLTSHRLRQPQRICCLALCGIHLGPLRYLSTSTILQPYFQYFESVAARELFEFQNTESEVSKKYVAALRRVVGNGGKMVYVASLNDQVVPLYSGLFTSVTHPLILRALYIDGDAYHSSDFLSNLLVLLLRILNSGISDSGLLAHLSEATAGSLNGVGHSTAYEELATYSLAVKYLFLTNDGLADHPDLSLESFNANTEQNDYEIPWALRDIIADERVAHYFSQEITQLRDAFRDWHPRTTILRDLKRKLQPIQRLPSSFNSTSSSSSKL